MARRSKGCGIFGGLFLILLGGGIWFLMNLLEPDLPEYDAVMKNGQPLPGKITAAEKDQSISINNVHPQRITYTWGEGGQATMLASTKESAITTGPVQVRVLGQHAYPEGIQPLRIPVYFKGIVIAFAGLGVLVIVLTIVRFIFAALALTTGAR